MRIILIIAACITLAGQAYVTYQAVAGIEQREVWKARV